MAIYPESDALDMNDVQGIDPEDVFVAPDMSWDAEDELPCETINHYPDAIGYPWNDEDAILPWL